MTLLHRLASIVRWIAHRNRVERDLDDELRAFVDMAAADQLRDGATAAEAPSSRMLPSVRWRCRQASAWTMRREQPAST